MKATINGITIEGTPQEIAEYQRLKEHEQPIKTATGTTPYWDYLPKIMSGQTTSVQTDRKCPNEGKPCFCTGACTGQSGTLFTETYIQSILQGKNDQNYGGYTSNL